MKKKYLLIVITMSLATASNFNASIGGLRTRGNQDDEFNKAMKDRLTMLQYQSPSELKAQAGQIQAKGTAIGQGLSAISDTKGTIEKGVSAYQDIKKVGKQAISSVEDLAGRVKSVTDQAGSTVNDARRAINSLRDPTNLSSATSTTTTSTSFTPSTQPKAPDTSIGGSAGELKPISGQANTFSGAGLPDIQGIGSGPKSLASGANVTDKTAQLLTQPVSAGTLSGPSDALSRSRNVFSGATRGGVGQQLHTMDQSANSALSSAYDSVSATRGMTGGVASSATNVHTDFNNALGDMKSQMGDAMDAINTHLGNISGQVQKAGEGVGELASGVAGVGKDVLSTGTKVVSGLSAGLETAGAVADALGPIGDVLGLGMAIFGGLEDSKVHKEDEDANKSAQAQVQAPVQGNVSQSANVSLDTAQKAQVGASSHY
jgi:hypothetical protein